MNSMNKSNTLLIHSILKKITNTKHNTEYDSTTTQNETSLYSDMNNNNNNNNSQICDNDTSVRPYKTPKFKSNQYRSASTHIISPHHHHDDQLDNTLKINHHSTSVFYEDLQGKNPNNHFHEGKILGLNHEGQTLKDNKTSCDTSTTNSNSNGNSNGMMMGCTSRISQRKRRIKSEFNMEHSKSMTRKTRGDFGIMLMNESVEHSSMSVEAKEMMIPKVKKSNEVTITDTSAYCGNNNNSIVSSPKNESLLSGSIHATRDEKSIKSKQQQSKTKTNNLGIVSINEQSNITTTENNNSAFLNRASMPPQSTDILQSKLNHPLKKARNPLLANQPMKIGEINKYLSACSNDIPKEIRKEIREAVIIDPSSKENNYLDVEVHNEHKNLFTDKSMLKYPPRAKSLCYYYKDFSERGNNVLLANGGLCDSAALIDDKIKKSTTVSFEVLKKIQNLYVKRSSLGAISLNNVNNILQGNINGGDFDKKFQQSMKQQILKEKQGMSLDGQKPPIVGLKEANFASNFKENLCSNGLAMVKEISNLKETNSFKTCRIIDPKNQCLTEQGLTGHPVCVTGSSINHGCGNLSNVHHSNCSSAVKKSFQKPPTGIPLDEPSQKTFSLFPPVQPTNLNFEIPNCKDALPNHTIRQQIIKNRLAKFSASINRNLIRSITPSGTRPTDDNNLSLNNEVKDEMKCRPKTTKGYMNCNESMLDTINEENVKQLIIQNPKRKSPDKKYKMRENMLIAMMDSKFDGWNDENDQVEIFEMNIH